MLVANGRRSETFTRHGGRRCSTLMPMTSGHPVPCAAPPLTSVALRDGRRVLLRPLLPTDRDALSTAFERLSDESQQLRFGAVPHTLSAARLHHLVDSVDAVNHLSLIHISEPTRRTPISY